MSNRSVRIRLEVILTEPHYAEKWADSVTESLKLECWPVHVNAATESLGLTEITSYDYSHRKA